MRRVELIPKALVVGLLVPTQPGAPDRDKVNRLWSDLSGRQEYRHLNVAGDGVQFLGATADDALVLQPPLIQVRSTARLGIQKAADEAQIAFRTVARHLGYGQFFNLGVKHVFHAPAVGNDARGFVMNRLLRCDPSALGLLERGGTLWTGVKYGIGAADGSAFTLVIEPFLTDNNLMFIDLDAQFPGEIALDRIEGRIIEAGEYATRTVSQYLDEAETGP
jgi:hypothetical protein